MSVISKISVGGTVYDISSESDIAQPSVIGSTNNTGSTITNDTYFYLNGILVRAKTDIASGATFTENTNYETVLNGGLNALNSKISSTKVRRNTVTTTLQGYGYYGWIATKSTNVISAYCEDHILVLHKRNDGWYVAELNSTGTGFVSGNTLSVTYIYTLD